MTAHTLSLSLLAIDAMGLEEAMSLRDNVLIPLSGQLDELRGDQEPANHLPTAMGLKALSILDAVARRSHIDEGTVHAFATVFGFLTPRPAELPGIAPKALDGADLLRQALAIAPRCRGYRGLSEHETYSVVMGAVLLTAARVLTGLPGSDDDFAQDGSALCLSAGARRFVLLFNGWLEAGRKRRLTEQERLNIRMVLDIVGPHLQSRTPAA